MDADNALVKRLLREADAATLARLRGARPGADLVKSVFRVSNFPRAALALARAPQAWEHVDLGARAPPAARGARCLEFEASRDGVLGGFLLWRDTAERASRRGRSSGPLSLSGATSTSRATARARSTRRSRAATGTRSCCSSTRRAGDGPALYLSVSRG